VRAVFWGFFVSPYVICAPERTCIPFSCVRGPYPDFSGTPNIYTLISPYNFFFPYCSGFTSIPFDTCIEQYRKKFNTEHPIEVSDIKAGKVGKRIMLPSSYKGTQIRTEKLPRYYDVVSFGWRP
jgi:hypothetical protein